MLANIKKAKMKQKQYRIKSWAFFFLNFNLDWLGLIVVNFIIIFLMG
jgi:hypothetical protein